MSTRERLNGLIDHLTEYQMQQAFKLLSMLLQEEEQDDVFCQELLKNYRNDPDPEKHDTISLEDFANELGINLNEI